MGDPMTTEQCRASQRECAQRIFASIEQLRRETKDDVGTIRESVQSIDRSVAAVKGFLGLNGNAGATAAHPHHRDAEDAERLHKRITDTVAAAMAAAAPAKESSLKDGVTLPRWAVVGLAGFVMLTLLLAAIAGERAREEMKTRTPVTLVPTK